LIDKEVISRCISSDVTPLGNVHRASLGVSSRYCVEGETLQFVLCEDFRFPLMWVEQNIHSCGRKRKT